MERNVKKLFSKRASVHKARYRTASDICQLLLQLHDVQTLRFVLARVRFHDYVCDGTGAGRGTPALCAGGSQPAAATCLCDGQPDKLPPSSGPNVCTQHKG
jgi:hypothetical protein